MIEIIEDCSPYFIRFRHTGSDDIIELCKKHKAEQIDSITDQKKRFNHHKLPVEDGLEILSKVPGHNELQYLDYRVSLFVTQPGVYYRPHRDGVGLRMGINYIVDVKDDKCITSWYSFDEFEGRPLDEALVKNNKSREIADFYWKEYKEHVPLKSFTAQQGDVILFNTDLYHDVNNVFSKNERTILTVRSGLWKQPTFEEARKVIFGF